MAKLLKLSGAALLLGVVGFVAYYGYFLSQAVPAATGLVAKHLCSLHYVSGLPVERARALYIDNLVQPLSSFLEIEVDRDMHTLTAVGMGLSSRVARYREGYGCTLVYDEEQMQPPREKLLSSAQPAKIAESLRRAAFDEPALEAAIDSAFANENNRRNTLAIVVYHGGRLVAERYAEGVTATTRLPGWSMAKSVTATLVGMLADQARLDVFAPGAIAEWRGTDDPRAAITIDHLLRMTSGMDLTEDKSGADFNTRMLFTHPDGASFSAQQNLLDAVGSRFDYMGGNTILASRAVRDAAGGELSASFRWIDEHLFAPLSMHTAILEPDQAGTFMGASFMLASAQDWAQLGLLWLNQGVYRGERLLSKEWVEYALSWTPQSGARAYGAGFWLNAHDGGKLRWPALPPDAFTMNGLQSQYVFVVPSADLVVVRLGASSTDPLVQPLVRDVLDAMRGTGYQKSSATAEDGSYLSWQEHIIDDPALGDPEVSGGDGLAMADLDNDGYLDIVSVHESDVVIGGTTFEDQYDGVARGHIRIAWGTADPNEWVLDTLAEGADAGGAEDVALVDLNGDGLIDVLAACELAHLIYLENPGDRSTAWKRLKPAVTRNRGSFIRVFAGDLNGDGRSEVIGVNKGAQNPTGEDALRPNPISWFEISGDPLDDASWQEHELTRVAWPINAPLVDLDGDGDLDIVGASTAERRIFWFENVSDGEVGFVEHRIEVPPTNGEPTGIGGFNMDFADFDADGRTDIVVRTRSGLAWLKQPEEPSGIWLLREIGSTHPDSATGLRLADIDGDGDQDLLTGGYSRGPRDRDGDPPLTTPLGRLAWFENPRTNEAWTRHDISRRYRGMFDAFVARDMDGDGDLDFVGTRGNSYPYDGVFWLEQRRTVTPLQSFSRARPEDSAEVALP